MNQNWEWWLSKRRNWKIKGTSFKINQISLKEFFKYYYSYSYESKVDTPACPYPACPRLVLQNFPWPNVSQKNLNPSNFLSILKTWGQRKDKTFSLRRTTPKIQRISSKNPENFLSRIRTKFRVYRFFFHFVIWSFFFGFSWEKILFREFLLPPYLIKTALLIQSPIHFFFRKSSTKTLLIKVRLYSFFLLKNLFGGRVLIREMTVIIQDRFLYKTLNFILNINSWSLFIQYSF